MKRFLSPQTNPGLYTALASLALSVWQAVQVQAAKGPLTWSEVGRVAAPVVIAALVQWQRSKTTPVKDPKDANGTPLLTANAHAAENFRQTIERGLNQGAGAITVQPPATTTGGAS